MESTESLKAIALSKEEHENRLGSKRYGEAKVRQFGVSILLYGHNHSIKELQSTKSPEFREILAKSLELGLAPGIDCNIVRYGQALTLVPTYKGLTKLLQAYWPKCHLTNFVWFEEHMVLFEQKTPTGLDRPPTLPRGTIDYNSADIVKKVRLIQITVFEEDGTLKAYKNYDFDWLVAKLHGVSNAKYRTAAGKRNQDVLEMYIKTAKKQFIKEFALHNREDLLYELEKAIRESDEERTVQRI